ncbi:MAG TPA: MG2 domain-containing protein, partial [Polyangia bacterium]
MPRSMRAGASVFAVAVLCAIGAPTARRSAAQPAPPPPAAAARSATGGGALGVHVVAPVRVYSNSVMAVRAAAHLATSETDWRPLPGAVIRATLSGAAVIATAEASTGPSGDADLRLHVPADAPGSCRLAVETRAPQGTDRYEGRVEVVTGGRLLVTTDKPLYQPGQTIHYRVLALRPFDLKPVAGRTVTFEVQDPRGNLLVQQEAALSRFGVAAHELPLAREVGTGTYRVRATLAATGGLPAITDERTVKVARYTPPKFQVTITPDHPFERPGVAATGVVAARYFFGKPVAGGRLTLDGGAHAVQAALGPDGTYRFTVPVTREFPLTLSARVRDGAAREEVAARTLTVDASPFHVEAVAEAGDLVPGLENHVYVAVVAPDGAPIRGARVEGAGDPARTDDAGVAVVTLTVARGESWR